MNIIRPQKLLLKNLSKLENILEEIDKSDIVENKLVENIEHEKIEIYDIKIENAIFNNVNIMRE